MKKTGFLGLLLALAGILFGMSATAQTTGEEKLPMANSKILIAYYSLSGNTREVAEAIREKTGGDLFEIQTVSAYPAAYKEQTEQAKKEISENYRPELKNKVANMAQYDVVFIGSPNWWGTITPAVSSFIESSDLSGKMVVPFITHGGGGVQNTVKNLTVQCRDCKVSDNPWVGYGSRTLGISGWLEDLGLAK